MIQVQDGSHLIRATALKRNRAEALAVNRKISSEHRNKSVPYNLQVDIKARHRQAD